VPIEAATPAETIKDQLPNLAEKLEVLGELLFETLGDSYPLIEFVMKAIGVGLRDLGLGWEMADLVVSGGGGPVTGTSPSAGMSPPTVNPFDEIRARLDGLTTSVGDIENLVRRIQDEANAIELKNDKLGELLGRTLVGEAWVVNPNATVTSPPRVPAVPVKEEMHGMEQALAAIQALLHGNVLDPAGGVPPGIGANPNPGAAPGPGVVPRPWPPNGPFIAEDEDPPLVSLMPDPAPIPRLDPRLKRIYVYEQGVFAPGASTDERVIRVRTNAFDLTGWVDLSAIRPGDSVTTEILVSVAGRPHRLFHRTLLATPGLRSFADLAGGENYISADDVRVVLRQGASADNFSTPIEIPYQFVVESRD
jgi:hypothetical protein